MMSALPISLGNMEESFEACMMVNGTKNKKPTMTQIPQIPSPVNSESSWELSEEEGEDEIRSSTVTREDVGALASKDGDCLDDDPLLHISVECRFLNGNFPSQNKAFVASIVDGLNQPIGSLHGHLYNTTQFPVEFDRQDEELQLLQVCETVWFTRDPLNAGGPFPRVLHMTSCVLDSCVSPPIAKDILEAILKTLAPRFDLAIVDCAELAWSSHDTNNAEEDEAATGMEPVVDRIKAKLVQLSESWTFWQSIGFRYHKPTICETAFQTDSCSIALPTSMSTCTEPTYLLAFAHQFRRVSRRHAQLKRPVVLSSSSSSSQNSSLSPSATKNGTRSSQSLIVPQQLFAPSVSTLQLIHTKLGSGVLAECIKSIARTTGIADDPKRLHEAEFLMDEWGYIGRRVDPKLFPLPAAAASSTTIRWGHDWDDETFMHEDLRSGRTRMIIPCRLTSRLSGRRKRGRGAMDSFLNAHNVKLWKKGQGW